MRLVIGLARVRIAVMLAAAVVASTIADAGGGLADESEATGNYLADIVIPRENALLPLMAETAQRQGDSLLLKFTSSESRWFRDATEACENFDFEKCLLYRLFTYEPEQEALVHWLQHAEGNDALLVQRETGKTLLLEQAPYPVPNLSSGQS